jgi:5-(carboxyamino)imidazole ribonucleotide synthase
MDIPLTSMIQRVGVIGGGQLAQMMAAAAPALGMQVIVQTPSLTDPAAALASDCIVAAIADPTATAVLASRCDVITLENELIDLEGLLPLARQGICFYPRLDSLVPLLDKYQQRSYLQNLGLPVPQFSALPKEFTPSMAADWEFPVVLKARRHGYDGQGTFMLKDRETLNLLWPNLQDHPLLLEQFIPFERELAVIAARSVAGEFALYPIVETQQVDQVCRRVIAPASLSPETSSAITAMTRTLMEDLQAVGVFGIELFLTAEGQILINEVSPRTHNSGHFTLEACPTSQFEQHLRAISGRALGPTNLISERAVMVNLLGYEHSYSDYAMKRQQLTAIPQAHVHWYGKTPAYPGRKLGHVTVLLAGTSPSPPEIVAQLESIWYEPELEKCYE